MQIPFVGPAYSGVSPNIDAQRCVNLYPEIDRFGGKTVTALVGTPGLELFAALPAPARGLYPMGGALYAVAGQEFYSIAPSGAITAIGSLLTSSGRVSMSDNGVQLMVSDGIAGYIFDAAANQFSQITSPGFSGAASADFIDGYFAVNTPGTSSFQVSSPYDGTGWDALDTAAAEGAPDGLVAVVNNHRELWLLGRTTTEIWYSSGAGNPPFSRMNGPFIETGLAARWSLAMCNGTLFYLARNRAGKGFVVRADGYSPRAVSTPAIEYTFSQYPDISDAFAYAYSEAGHDFYVITFPSGNATWAYDDATGLWHERQSYGIGRHRADSYAFFNGSHIVGDFSNGNLYRMRSGAYTDNGDPIRRIRAARHVWNGLKNVFISRLQIDMETGVGDGSAGQGASPQAMLSWSDDGGHTWGSERWTGMGGAGQYRARAVWRRLGRARDRVFRVTITDPVKVVIIGAEMEAVAGRH